MLEADLGTVSVKRRQLLRGGLGLVGLGLLAGCGMLSPSGAPGRVSARVGVLTTYGMGATPENLALLDGLRTAGWTLGENLKIDYRFAQTPESVIPTAAELVALQPDVIVAEGNNHVKALKAATDKVPIIMALCNDPVRTGLVASQSRPGRNITGVASLSAELTEKRLDLLRQTLPGASRIMCIWIPDISADAIDEQAIHAAASKLGFQAQILDIKSGPEVRNAFAAAVRGGVDAVVMLTDILRQGALGMSDVAASTRLPVVSGNSELARAGTLLAYGPSLPGLFRRAATYTDKILRGAKPADLPVEQPTEFEFVINQKTALALGLTVPDLVVKQATEIIH